MQAEVKANPVYSMNTDIKEKAVIFDIDNTLLNPEQRFRDAIRAGLIDKKGKAIVKGLMSKGKAYQKRNDFLYSCLLYTSPSPRDGLLSRMPSSA